MTTERERFEAFARTLAYNLSRRKHAPCIYDYYGTQDAWGVWRAALATKPDHVALLEQCKKAITTILYEEAGSEEEWLDMQKQVKDTLAAIQAAQTEQGKL